MSAKNLNNYKSAPMNNKTFFISKPAFNELCKYVCYQMQMSGSEQLDRETLNFAIYWQVCFLLNEQVEFVAELNSKTILYQQLLQDRIDSQMVESFDVSEIIDENISELFQKQYPKPDNFNNRLEETSEGWVEKLSYC